MAADLSQLPSPNVVSVLSFSDELQAIKDVVIGLDASLSDAVNTASDPLALALHAIAYRNIVKEQEFNDRAKGLLLALSSGADLDHIGITYYNNTQRLTITPADNTTIPPTPEVMESDADYLARLLISQDGFSTAGPEAAYLFFAKSAAGNIKDVSAVTPAPKQATITILSHIGDGVADAGLITAVNNALGDDVRPMTDEVIVQSATVIHYTVNATIKTYPGVFPDTVRAAAQAAAETYATEQHNLGRDITLTRLYAAIAVDGVMDITLNNTIGTDIIANLVADAYTAYYCDSVTITAGAIDE